MTHLFAVYTARAQVGSWNVDDYMESFLSICSWGLKGDCFRSVHLFWSYARPLPNEFFMATEIESFAAYGYSPYEQPTKVVGTFPTELARFTRLRDLRFVTDDVYKWSLLGGTHPSELGLLTQLQRLVLEGQTKLAGQIPTEVGLMSRLTNLQIQKTKLNGTIPSELGTLTNAKVLLLRRNSLQGTIPSELGRLTKLEELYLKNNSLHGTIPSELLALSNLRFFDLRYNNTNPRLIPRLREASLREDCRENFSLIYRYLVA